MHQQIINLLVTGPDGRDRLYRRTMSDDHDQQLARATELLRAQTAKIKTLEQEVARLNAVIETSHDALMHLQNVYSDPNAHISDIVRAAAVAINFERSRPPSVNASIDGSTLFNLLEAKRLAKRKPAGAVIDLTPTTPAA
jgi:hypothetical protein